MIHFIAFYYLFQKDTSCFLMENGDVELKIGNTKKLTQLTDGSVKLNGQIVSIMALDAQDHELMKGLTVKLKSLEEAISAVDPSSDMYPAIFGRRAATDTPSKSNFTLATNFTSLVDRSPESVPESDARGARAVREVHVDGVGLGKPLAGGGVCVQFYDKTQLSVLAGRKQVAFTDRHGIRTEYPEGSLMPAYVRQRLDHLPRVMEMLR